MTVLYIRLTNWVGEREEGATGVEYGLLVALIAAVIIGTVATIGDEISEAFDTVLTELQAN
jgi:pilus assembly protein Flp/PilA